MDVFILSQVLMFIAMICVFIAFQIKDDKWFRLMFVLSGILAASHFILLGAGTAAAMVFINTSRWLISIFSRSRYWFWFYILLFCVSLYFTYTNWISLVPFVAGLIGTLAVFQREQVKARKIYMGVDVLWILNNVLIHTPVGVIAHILFLISGFVGYQRVKKF